MQHIIQVTGLVFTHYNNKGKTITEWTPDIL
jgi:hypothetical protein